MQVENNRTQSTATLADLWRLMQDIDGLFQSRLELVLAFSEKAAPTLLLPSTKRGEIESTFDPVELAEFVLPSWEAAILRMKVLRSSVAPWWSLITVTASSSEMCSTPTLEIPR
jgi:hypothetical protein